MTQSNAVTGFVGLGNMGSRMARRLVDSGQHVVGYDVRPVEIEGMAQVEDLRTLAHESDTVVLSLPDGNIVGDVCARLVAGSDRRVTTIIDTSTIGPEAAQRTFHALAAIGVQYVDAPVSGGIRGAERGTLSMMLATDQATFDRIDPVIAPIAARRFLCGSDAGQGQMMKLLNNFVFAAGMIATSEAIAAGLRHGLDATLMTEVLAVSSGRNMAATDIFPASIITGAYDFGFSTQLMRKDVRLYAEHTHEAPGLHEIGTLTSELWGRFLDTDPDSDLTRIFDWIRDGGAQQPG